MNVLITSGGTIEKIDNVRSISNMSTGKLGSVIADAFLKSSVVNKVFYVCSKTTILPKSYSSHSDDAAIDNLVSNNRANVEIIYANSVADLENTIKDVLAQTKIDVIVHCMAVSDYRVKSVTTLSALYENTASGANDADDKNFARTSNTGVNNDGKISSELDDMVLLMERTPKVISLFKELSPNSTLIGFKLLDNVPLDTLIDKGFGVLTKNNCSFVLANDLKDIEGEKHIGYLIDKDKNFTKYTTKFEIANAIVDAVAKV